MGKANPFIRFQPAAVNGGFLPLAEYLTDLLADLETDISGASLVGLTCGQAIADIKALIEPFNLTPTFADFRLVYPSPWPTITGTQTLTFYVQNDQLSGFYPDQVITIELDLVNGVVVADTIGLPSPPTFTGVYDSPIYPVEILVQRALEVYDQLGASLFPVPYLFSDSLAVSGLARTQDWEIIAGVTIRNPAPTLPYAPNQTFEFPILTPDKRYIISLLDNLIRFALENPTFATVQTYINAFSLPDGWTQSLTANSPDEFELTISSDDYRFKAVGIYTTSLNTDRWHWQRFVATTTAPTVSFLTVFGSTLPYEPDTGLLYQTYWYDLEQICFEGQSNTVPQFYGLPAKSGDVLRFNILPDQGNFTGLRSASIGLFDSDNVFIQEIGLATYPACKLLNEFSVTISGASFGPMIDDTFDNSLDTYFDAVDCSGESLGNLITIPFADLDTTNITDYADSVIAYINGLDGFSATYDLGTNLTFTITIDDPNSLANQINFSNGGAYEFEGTALNRCTLVEQMQGTITMPYVADGCYKLGLYDGDLLLSLSNPIQVNNSDAFSQILEYAGDEGTISEGFEYYNTWSQRIRIGLQAGAPEATINDSTYRQSNGVTRRPANKSDLKLSLQTNFIDKPTQLAMFGATRHPVFVLAGQSLFVTGDVATNHSKDFSTEDSYFELAQMEFDTLVQGFQPANNACLGC